MIQACHQSMSNCMDSNSYTILRQGMGSHQSEHLISHKSGKPLPLCTMNSGTVGFTTPFSDLGASILEWASWFPLILSWKTGIGYLWWKIYADSTLDHMVSGKTYARATRGHLQGTIASTTIMTSMVLITAIAPFLSGVKLSDIHDTETTAPYWEVPRMPVSIATTDKSVWISRIWKEQK